MRKRVTITCVEVHERRVREFIRVYDLRSATVEAQDGHWLHSLDPMVGLADYLDDIDNGAHRVCQYFGPTEYTVNFYNKYRSYKRMSP